MQDLADRLTAIAVGGVVSALATWRARAYALRKNVLDQPSARGSHTVATPRGGGVGIICGVVAGVAALGLAVPDGMALVSTLWGVGVAGLIVAGVGWWDDHGHVAAKVRAAVHAGAAAIAVSAAGGMGKVALGATAIDAGFLGSVVAVVGMVWLTNLYNFMDGLDGMAGSQGVTAAAGLGALLIWDGRPGHASVALVVAAATAGFLVFNWPPARVFMGDVGSGYLGCTFGGMLVVLSHVGAQWTWAAMILLGPFIADATTTLLRRMVGGQRWHEAHRSHAYQNLSRRWSSHRRVTLTLIALVVCWCLPWAVLAIRMPHLGIVPLLCCYCPLVGLALALGAGVPGRYET